MTNTEGPDEGLREHLALRLSTAIYDAAKLDVSLTSIAACRTVADAVLPLLTAERERHEVRDNDRDAEWCSCGRAGCTEYREARERADRLARVVERVKVLTDESHGHGHREPYYAWVRASDLAAALSATDPGSSGLGLRERVEALCDEAGGSPGTQHGLVSVRDLRAALSATDPGSSDE